MDETFTDLGSLSDEALKAHIDRLTAEETEVSYRRRILHGQIDILRAELVSRLRQRHDHGEAVISGADVDRLSEILGGRVGGLRAVDGGAADGDDGTGGDGPSA
ncbi:MAG: hypothetical protein M0P31_07150 [Solirubrobacteraceae bacterium]|nr:hypothetical protein [Solirubrobacteraceae bacterium]